MYFYQHLTHKTNLQCINLYFYFSTLYIVNFLTLEIFIERMLRVNNFSTFLKHQKSLPTRPLRFKYCFERLLFLFPVTKKSFCLVLPAQYKPQPLKMKTLQKFGLFFYFLLPLVKLAPPKQHSATFYDPGLATLEETIFKQSYEDIIFKEDYEDKPQDAVKNKVFDKFCVHLCMQACSMGNYENKWKKIRIM